MVSTTTSVTNGVDSNIPWFTLFKRCLTKTQLWMGNFKHIIEFSSCHVKIMFNVQFMILRTFAVF